MANNFVELCSTGLWKVELASNRSIENEALVFLNTHIKHKKREINWEWGNIIKQKVTSTLRFGKLQPVYIAKKFLKFVLKRTQGYNVARLSLNKDIIGLYKQKHCQFLQDGTIELFSCKSALFFKKIED